MSKNFIKNTLSPELFIIQNVKGDNACFYRAIANYIVFAQTKNNKNIEVIKSFKNWGETTDIDNIDTFDSYQNELAQYLQTIIYNYIITNSHQILPFMGGITIKDAVPFIHGITYDEYMLYYNQCAFEDIPTDEDFVIDRWGSSLELFVVAEIIKCPIIVFNTQTWSKRYNKIINGKVINNKPEKNVRLKPSIIVGKKYIGIRLPIYLIWREYKGEGHYMSLYPKDKEAILQYIKFD